MRPKVDASQVETHGKAGQQPGGVNAAARELGISKSEAHRSIKIDDITPEAMEAAAAAGLKSQADLLMLATYSDEEQVEAVAEIVKKKAAAKATPKPKWTPTTPPVVETGVEISQDAADIVDMTTAPVEIEADDAAVAGAEFDRLRGHCGQASARPDAEFARSEP